MRYNPVYEERMYRPMVREYFAHGGYYNYGYWEGDTQDQSAACRNLVSKLLDFLPENPGRVLEVACGLGGTTADVKRRFGTSDLVAIDLSARNVHNTRINAPGCSASIMDAAQLAFANGCIGSVVSVEAAFHFDTREQFFNEAYRVLEPGGRLVLSDILFRRVRSRFLPRQNFVAGIAGYEDLLRRARFREVLVVDATEACWGGFRRNLRLWGRQRFHSTRASVAAGLRSRRILGLTLWLGLLRLALSRYVLVAASK